MCSGMLGYLVREVSVEGRVFAEGSRVRVIGKFEADSVWNGGGIGFCCSFEDGTIGNVRAEFVRLQDGGENVGDVSQVAERIFINLVREYHLGDLSQGQHLVEPLARQLAVRSVELARIFVAESHNMF